jgi:hypothetical protein
LGQFGGDDPLLQLRAAYRSYPYEELRELIEELEAERGF